MKKGLVALLLIILFLDGCIKASTEKSDKQIDDLQKTACEEADKAGTCQTRLVEVGIIMPDECCEAIGKCCKNE